MSKHEHREGPIALSRRRRARNGVALFACLASMAFAGSLAVGCAARSKPPVVTPAGPAPDIEAIEVFGDVPLSGLRFIGTHNSYHEAPRLFGLPFLPIAFSGKHRYVHPSLADQLDGPDGSAGAVRQLELDVHMRRFDDQLRVLHVPWIDNQSSCKTLEDCLREVMAWSDRQGGMHAPVLIWIEPKDETPIDRWLSLGYYQRVDLERVEQAILDVVPRERLLTPDDVRRGERTLPAALAAHGWPTLAALRGKLIFAVLDENEHRTRYVEGHPDRNLAGRLMFVRSTQPTDPWAAMFKVNNAVPTLRDMQAFGREALADPELAALQVYPAAPEPESSLATWWKNLWQQLRDADGPGEERDAGSPTPTGEARETDEQENAPKTERTPALDAEGAGPRDATTSSDAEKDLKSESKPATLEVDRRLRRELETVYADTRAEARQRHLQAVAELEEQVRLEGVPGNADLAIALENARRSRPYRDALRERLHFFIDEQRRATILGLVRQGFIVTTTADEPQHDAASNRERLASTLLSGAQFISTDALLPRRNDGYVFELPDAPIRCNALVDPDGCAPRREQQNTDAAR